MEITRKGNSENKQSNPKMVPDGALLNHSREEQVAAATENVSELFKFPPDVCKGQKDVLAGRPGLAGDPGWGRGLGGAGQASPRALKMFSRHIQNVLSSVTTLQGRCYQFCVSECDHVMS